jgi:hypothetical protein
MLMMPRELAVVEFAFHDAWADFRIDTIGVDGKLGFGGLAIGEGKLNTYVALSQISQLHAEIDLTALSLSLTFLK